MEVMNLRCEFATSPIGINTTHPRLQWSLRSSERAQYQSAYRVCAATSLGNLTNSHFDLWDSGVIQADSQMVTYAGRDLTAGIRVWWQVFVWDKNGLLCPPSEPAVFELGLLNLEDWSAVWTGYPAGWNGQALYFRNSFRIDNPDGRVRVYISGLGCYQLYLNGSRIGDYALAPAWSTYSKRVYYNAYEIDTEINAGENVIGVIVGNGWYGLPQLLLQINVIHSDGSMETVCQSGAGWKVSQGPIVTNSLYDGETYDARLEMPGWTTTTYPTVNLAGWASSMIVDGPEGKLVPEIAPPMQITDFLTMKSVSQPKPNVYVVDMGQNFAGWVRLRVKGKRGEKVILKYAETLYGDGTVNQENLRCAAATDTYILKGGEIEEWEPSFTYHGFRYIQVEGLPYKPNEETLMGCVMRSANTPSGSFESSSELLNAIHKMVWWTEVSNQPSIPTDCPQRDERMGWLNDMAARSEQIVYNFDVALFLSKWVTDIADTQDPNTGAITDTAPFRWGHRPADPVSVCYLLIPWLLYVHYDDRRTLRDHYAGMKAWVDFLHNQAQNDIVQYSYWGDWSPPIAESLHGDSAVSRNTPGPLMSTGMSYYATILFSQIAQVLGKANDAETYRVHAHRIAESFNHLFYNPETGGYGGNNQASNAFPLYLRIVPDAIKAQVIGNLISDIDEKYDGHLSTGNLCTKYLLEVLTAEHAVDVAYRIATQKTYPGWGYMLENGATTLWERWERATGGGMNSHNHPMMGSIGSWLYRALAGIQADPTGPGFRFFHIKPQMVDDLTWTRATLKTMHGEIKSSWERKGHHLHLTVTVPVGCSAKVYMPKAKQPFIIKESNSIVWGNLAKDLAGILAIADETNSITFTVSSGTYNFVRILED